MTAYLTRRTVLGAVATMPFADSEELAASRRNIAENGPIRSPQAGERAARREHATHTVECLPHQSLASHAGRHREARHDARPESG